MLPTRLAPRSSLPRASRGGSLYVVVLGVSLIVTVVSFTALYVARVELRGLAGVEDRILAQIAARSAIEAALVELASEAAWRSTFVHGEMQPDLGWTALPNTGEYRWQLLDADGILNDDDNDSVRLRGIGRAGNAVAVESVLLEPRGTALDCLEVSYYTDSNITLSLTVNLDSDQIVAAAGNVTATAWESKLAADVEAGGVIAGNVTGSQTAPAPPRRLPGDTVFDYYKSAGTWLQAADLPSLWGRRLLEKCVLSPTSNPFGPTNPRGIYVLDCGGSSVTIQNCRIEGTLLLLNPGSTSVVSGSIHWRAAAENFPALLCDGDIAFFYNDASLSEAALEVNFNPIGTPYEGSFDEDTDDLYPGGIYGLVYVRGTLSMPADGQDSNVTGTVIAHAITQQSDCRITFSPIYASAPPPGFAHGESLRPIPGSWRREAY